jgi:uncharacterized repeat protein (TIGR03803 family)
MRLRTVTHVRTTILLLVGTIAFSLIAQGQTFTVLHTFTGPPDGAYPVSGLVRDETGSFYGTTAGGGTSNAGTVFQLRLSTFARVSVLHSFTETEDDGQSPFAPLAEDGHGNFYGTTPDGGAFGSGTVFKMDKTGKENVLYSFAGALDGAFPYAGLVLDKRGNLYGATQSGGSGASYGTIFKVDGTGNQSVLYTFSGGAAGEYPFAGLVLSKGRLYGTTAGDGASIYGTLFRLTKSGRETLLHTFAGRPDGAFPIATLVRDPAGNLYGTTQQGGILNSGTIFKLDTTGGFTVVYNFVGTPDGKWPYAGLVRDEGGNFYGTTALGGAFDSGTIFKLDTTGNVTVLYSFTGGADGAFPRGSLVRDTAGTLYGTASNGGASSYGTIFKLTPR